MRPKPWVARSISVMGTDLLLPLDAAIAALEGMITRLPLSTTCPQTSYHYRPKLTSGNHNVVDRWAHPCLSILDYWRTDMAQLAEHSLDEEIDLQA